MESRSCSPAGGRNRNPGEAAPHPAPRRKPPARGGGRGQIHIHVRPPHREDQGRRHRRHEQRPRPAEPPVASRSGHGAARRKAKKGENHEHGNTAATLAVDHGGRRSTGGPRCPGGSSPREPTPRSRWSSSAGTAAPPGTRSQGSRHRAQTRYARSAGRERRSRGSRSRRDPGTPGRGRPIDSGPGRPGGLRPRSSGPDGTGTAAGDSASHPRGTAGKSWRRREGPSPPETGPPEGARQR